MFGIGKSEKSEKSEKGMNGIVKLLPMLFKMGILSEGTIRDILTGLFDLIYKYFEHIKQAHPLQEGESQHVAQFAIVGRDLYLVPVALSVTDQAVISRTFIPINLSDHLRRMNVAAGLDVINNLNEDIDLPALLKSIFPPAPVDEVVLEISSGELPEQTPDPEVNPEIEKESAGE